LLESSGEETMLTMDVTVNAMYRELFLWPIIAIVMFGLPLTAFGIYVIYWYVQLMKAMIRALDRWNPKQPIRHQEALPNLRDVSPTVTDATKYGPK
jgi:hypothetical protein